MPVVWRTGISQAFWYSPGHWPPFARAEISLGQRIAVGEHCPSCCWFDELLKGGLTLPGQGDGALTMLLTGPPGTGKTTFALELCYRLADPTEERGQIQTLCFRCTSPLIPNPSRSLTMRGHCGTGMLRGSFFLLRLNTLLFHMLPSGVTIESKDGQN